SADGTVGGSVDVIDIVLPAHNEADSIGATLREFHEVAQAGGLTVRFIVSEDGSSDATVAIVRALAATLPITLLTEARRKGYSRAVTDGLRASTADLVACVDADGQCDPRDLVRLVRASAIMTSSSDAGRTAPIIGRE